MIGLDWPWRRRKETDPFLRYLQPIHISGPVRFDPALQTAGEIIQARQRVRLLDLTSKIRPAPDLMMRAFA